MPIARYRPFNRAKIQIMFQGEGKMRYTAPKMVPVTSRVITTTAAGSGTIQPT